jgi:hypothetical protein
MSDDKPYDKADDTVRAEIMRQLIIFGFDVVAVAVCVVVLRLAHQPDVMARLRTRIGFGPPPGRDVASAALRQVRREISLLEHGQA